MYWHNTKCVKGKAYVVTGAYFHLADVVVKQKHIEYEEEVLHVQTSIVIHIQAANVQLQAFQLENFIVDECYQGSFHCLDIYHQNTKYNCFCLGLIMLCVSS